MKRLCFILIRFLHVCRGQFEVFGTLPDENMLKAFPPDPPVSKPIQSILIRMHRGSVVNMSVNQHFNNQDFNNQGNLGEARKAMLAAAKLKNRQKRRHELMMNLKQLFKAETGETNQDLLEMNLPPKPSSLFLQRIIRGIEQEFIQRLTGNKQPKMDSPDTPEKTVPEVPRLTDLKQIKQRLQDKLEELRKAKTEEKQPQNLPPNVHNDQEEIINEENQFSLPDNNVDEQEEQDIRSSFLIPPEMGNALVDASDPHEATNDRKVNPLVDDLEPFQDPAPPQFSLIIGRMRLIPQSSLESVESKTETSSNREILKLPVQDQEVSSSQSTEESLEAQADRKKEAIKMANVERGLKNIWDEKRTSGSEINEHIMAPRPEGTFFKMYDETEEK